jgi:hypothetical protein
MRVRTWLLWLSVAAGSALFAWSRLDAPEVRLDADARRAAAASSDPDTLGADARGPRLVGVGTAGGAGGGAVGGSDPAVGAPPSIELVVVDAAGRAVPRFQVRMKAFETVGSHGGATLALAFPGNAAPPGPYDVRVYGACDEAGVGLDLGAAHVQFVSCDGGPARVVLPAVDALTIQVRDEGGSGVQGLGVRIVTPAKAADDATAATPPWPPDLGALSLAGVTGADGAVRLARAASHLLVDVECDVPAGFLPCVARGVEPSSGTVELELRRGCAAEVQVDSPLGRVAGAQVELKSDGHGAGESAFYASQRADEEGRARFPLLDPRARYSLFVQPPGWERLMTAWEAMVSSTFRTRSLPGEDPFEALAPLMIGGWVPADTSVRLERARVLSGHVRDGEGVPMTDAIVSVYASGRLVGRLETDDEGRFTWAQAPEGPLVLHVALAHILVEGEPELERVVAPQERDGLELRVETVAQRVLDVAFPSVRARDDACGGPWGMDLDVSVRVQHVDGSWGAFTGARAQLVPVEDPAAPRARLRLQELERGAHAEVVVWQQDVGFVHVPLPAVGARATVPLERGEALHLVTGHARRGADWRVTLTSERFPGLELDVFVAIEEDGVLVVGGLPAGPWEVHCMQFDFSGHRDDELARAPRFEGELEARARTGERTPLTEVPTPAR